MEKAERKNRAKQAAARAAVDFVKESMVIGLGTGSTAAYFIQELAIRCKEGLNIQAVSSSKRSEELARDLNIPVGRIDEIETLDLTIDGADEIDTGKRMIKGGGGALLREKILARMCKEMLVIVDNEKCVAQLGSFPLPVEILPFAWRATIHHFSQMGLSGKLRQKDDKTVYITDNGNYIYDIAEEYLKGDLLVLDEKLHAIPGVMETGFFFDFASKVLVGYGDGQVKVF